jgi:hypothetical protein
VAVVGVPVLGGRGTDGNGAVRWWLWGGRRGLVGFLGEEDGRGRWLFEEGGESACGCGVERVGAAVAGAGVALAARAAAAGPWQRWCGGVFLSSLGLWEVGDGAESVGG